MSTGVADVGAPAEVEYRTTAAPCPLCMITSPLDDERPKSGLVRWEVKPALRLEIGAAVHFECPNGHSSEDDPDLRKAFPSRRL
jgi:hypothetical protein